MLFRSNHKKITCFGKHENKLRLLSKLGIKTSLGITGEDEHEFDIVVEATGRESGVVDSLRLAKPRAVIVLKSTTASKNKVDLTSAIVNEVTFVGSRCGPFIPAIRALETGVVNVDDLIQTIYPLDKLDEALEAATNPDLLKIMLRP